MYVNTKTACRLYQVSPNTLRRWDKQNKINTIRTPSNLRMYSTQMHKNAVSNTNDVYKKQKICYCRVSSIKQKDDLARQIQFMQSKYPEHTIIQDIGSGINWKRKGLQTILELSMSNKLQEVVVAHRDRLCRFAFELIQWILEKNKVKLMVLDEEIQSSEQELAQDLLSIVHIFSCKQMGKRRYKKTKKTKS
jgi:putative resolvase